jgi:hypothetical protein
MLDVDQNSDLHTECDQSSDSAPLARDVVLRGAGQGGGGAGRSPLAAGPRAREDAARRDPTEPWAATGPDPIAKTTDERLRSEAHIRGHRDHAGSRLARDLGVTRPTVRLARPRLVARGELAPVAVVVRGDGHRYPARLRFRD